MNKDEQFLWYHVAWLEQKCIEAWRKAKAPSLTCESFMAERVAAVETTVTRKPKGAISVTIVLVPKRAADGEVEYFRLQRTANKLYHVVGKELTSS